MDASEAFFGQKPVAVVDEVINCFSDYVCDTADAMEASLAEHPDLAQKRARVKQGVDHWQLKVQRYAGKNFDKFELYTLKNILHVPIDLQQESQGPVVERDNLDKDIEGLWVRFQQALAMRRELQRKVVSAQKATQLWEANRQAVHQLAETYEPDGVRSIMQDAEQLTRTQQQSWMLLRGLDVSSCAEEHYPEGPAQPRALALQQRFTHRRMNTSTVSVGDLQQLSSMLCAS